MAQIKCPNCGATLRHEMRFCEFCGTAMTKESSVEEQYTEFDAFKDSIRPINVAHRMHMHSSRWLLVMVFYIASLEWISPYLSYDTKPTDLLSMTFVLRTVIWFNAYVAVNFLAHTLITKHYVGTIRFPKDAESVKAATEYIEQQLRVVGGKSRWLWKNSIRLEVWLKCLKRNGCYTTCRSSKIAACIIFAAWWLPSWAFKVFIVCY